jgi:hypothetical protein
MSYIIDSMEKLDNMTDEQKAYELIKSAEKDRKEAL